MIFNHKLFFKLLIVMVQMRFDFQLPYFFADFSAKPLAKGLFSFMSNNLNLIDELPRFNTKISIISPSQLILRLNGTNQNGVDNIFH